MGTSPIQNYMICCYLFFQGLSSKIKICCFLNYQTTVAKLIDNDVRSPKIWNISLYHVRLPNTYEITQ